MYKSEFEKILNTKLPKALLIYGDDTYAIEQYISYYIDKLGAKEDKLKLYFEEYDFDQAKSYLSQNSLFGNTNLLILKTEKALTKKDAETLLELIQKSGDNYLIYVFLGIQKEIKPLVPLFKSSENVEVRLFEPTIKESLVALRKKATYIELDIDDYVLEHLILSLNNNLMLANGELDKLKILNRAITTKDIGELVFCETSMSAERFIIDICNKKMSFTTLNTLLESGNDINAIIRSTQVFLNQILLFQAHIKLNGVVNSQDILGYKLPKQIEEQRAMIANRIKSSKLLKAFEHLLQSEIEIKRAQAPQKETLLYAMFIELQNIL